MAFNSVANTIQALIMDLKGKFNKGIRTEDLADKSVTIAKMADDVVYIIETGSNENGTWRKWVDGTLECWGAKNFGTVAIDKALGPLTISAPLIINWPFEFTEIKSTSFNRLSTDNPSDWVFSVLCADATTTGQTIYLFRTDARTHTNCAVGFNAKGRWK
jgi:hypothetical protein